MTGLGGREGDDGMIYLYLFVVRSHLAAMFVYGGGDCLGRMAKTKGQ